MKTWLTIVALGLSLCLAGGSNASSAKAKYPKVKSVSYSGNTTYDDVRLEGLMLTRPSKFLTTSKYHPDVFLDDLETLVSFYRQNGFLQARIVDTSVTIDSKKNEVDIAIVLEEGNRTFVEGITIFGNSFFSDSVLMRYVAFGKTDPLRRPLIEDAVVAMLSLYSEHGYIDAAITPKVQVNAMNHGLRSLPKKTELRMEAFRFLNSCIQESFIAMRKVAV